MASPFYTAGHTSGFVVDSILRSTGSLNEMVILEHEQFIGDESSVDLGRTSSSSSSSSSTSSLGCSSGGVEAALLFGGAVSGSLFDDTGDSSDYFCGVSDKQFVCSVARVMWLCVSFEAPTVVVVVLFLLLRKGLSRFLVHCVGAPFCISERAHGLSWARVLLCTEEGGPYTTALFMACSPCATTNGTNQTLCKSGSFSC